MRETGIDTVLRAVELTKRVTTAEGPLTILAAVDLALGRGESLAITGVSGSGKTTLLGLLAGLDRPSGGRVELLGQDLGACDEDALAALRRRHIGFVFQNFQLLPNLTALENVMLPLELKESPDPRPAATAMLERVGLGARCGHYPRMLSGGEQQRVALARAFVVQPDLLLADEPTGALDRNNAERITELLFALRDDFGAALVLVTHDDRLSSRCDQVLNLDTPAPVVAAA